MGNSSSGLETPTSLVLDQRVAMVRGPSLPIYIVSITTIFDAVDNIGVMPVVRPTVPIAEKLSNSISRRGSAGSRTDSTVVTVTVHIKPSEMIPNDLCIIPSGIRLPNALASRPVEWDTRDLISAKKVVVFIPPPVDPGDAPINISTHITIIPAVEKFA